MKTTTSSTARRSPFDNALIPHHMRWLKTKGTAWLSLASLIAYLALSVGVRNEVRFVAESVLKIMHRR